jgi:hypothetical protein
LCTQALQIDPDIFSSLKPYHNEILSSIAIVWHPVEILDIKSVLMPVKGKVVPVLN